MNKKILIITEKVIRKVAKESAGKYSVMGCYQFEIPKQLKKNK